MLSLDSLFSTSQFSDEGFDRPRWWNNSVAAKDDVDSLGSTHYTCFYTSLRKVTKDVVDAARVELTSTTASDSTGLNLNVHEIIWHDAATGEESVLVSYQQLIPHGNKAPLSIDDYETSADRSKVLIFTNSEKVWRLKTRGSYWVLDFNATSPEGKLVQLGGSENLTKLMFATFSPDTTKVAFVRFNNLYVQDLATLVITPLTVDGSDLKINGTFDWVYEEELSLRNGYRYI